MWNCVYAGGVGWRQPTAVGIGDGGVGVVEAEPVDVEQVVLGDALESCACAYIQVRINTFVAHWLESLPLSLNPQVPTLCGMHSCAEWPVPVPGGTQ